MPGYIFLEINVPGSSVTTAGGFWGDGGINAADQIIGQYGVPNGGGFNNVHGYEDTFGFRTEINPPGVNSDLVTPVAINDSGEIVGSYNNGGNIVSFLDDHGVYTTLDPPNSVFTVNVTGINDRGQVIGAYETTNFLGGYLYQHGVYTPISVPSSSLTFPQAINDSGEIAGYYEDSSGNNYGFLYSNGTYTKLDPPGSVTIGQFGPDPAESTTNVTGINNAGEVVGTFEDSSFVKHGFLYNNGTYTEIDPSHSTSTTVTDINASGEIVGYFTSTGHNKQGFVDIHGVYQTINVPGSISTEVIGINVWGQLVGDYEDTSGHTHGFVATPVPLLGVSGFLFS